MKQPASPEPKEKKPKILKLIRGLQDKKTRTEQSLFLVEGEKSFLEAIESEYEAHSVFATRGFLDAHPDVMKKYAGLVHIVDENELASVGTMITNKSVIGVFHQRQNSQLSIGSEVVLALSDVNDPGNLGTIIRIADWYGIKKIIASTNTVDVYNPKVISATKGSFTRVAVYYQDLAEFLGSNEGVPIFGADLDGESVHTMKFPAKGILLMGSESHGIAPEITAHITKKITIPKYGGAESLNVGVATGIILDRWLGSLGK
jgi:RNA methyltransferase, TrmH family